jgi:hypothetical protein
MRFKLKQIKLNLDFNFNFNLAAHSGKCLHIPLQELYQIFRIINHFVFVIVNTVGILLTRYFQSLIVSDSHSSDKIFPP